ncbi:MAG: putative surface protein with fasciclin (FAS1) repeats [Planctomycetota bacterium]|jgi:uncharacterized surface protein with fasciclin (FAS1) repeats
MTMKSIQNYLSLLAILLFTSGILAQTVAQTNPIITTEYQGATFTSEKSLVENLEASDLLSYSQLVIANPNLASLTGADSYTIFVAADAFFNAMEEEERDAFLASSNEYLQKQVLSTFIVLGRVDSGSMMHELKKREGQPLFLKTLSGANVGVKIVGEDLVLFDTDHQVRIIASDFYHSKGFFHITDGYFLPEGKE